MAAAAILNSVYTS